MLCVKRAPEGCFESTIFKHIYCPKGVPTLFSAMRLLISMGGKQIIARVKLVQGLGALD